MRGYKAFNNDMTCRGFQYEIGKTYRMDGEVVPCKRGFHFCKSIADCYKFYPKNDETIICEVESGDITKTDDNINWATNELAIVAEVGEQWQRRGNTTTTSIGYCNTGDSNTGNFNTGWYNTGDFNTGWYNIGECNAGSFNRGDCNTGNHNTGNSNIGDYNAGDFNTGCFCVNNNQPHILMFDTPSSWTMEDWIDSEACSIMTMCPIERQARQKWWNELPIVDKQIIFELPNFNADKFCKCVGLEHCTI